MTQMTHRNELTDDAENPPFIWLMSGSKGDRENETIMGHMFFDLLQIHIFRAIGIDIVMKIDGKVVEKEKRYYNGE